MSIIDNDDLFLDLDEMEEDIAFKLYNENEALFVLKNFKRNFIKINAWN
jgi:hypothetical protein